jgi:hypothetical protein
MDLFIHGKIIKVDNCVNDVLRSCNQRLNIVMRETSRNKLYNNIRLTQLI